MRYDWIARLVQQPGHSPADSLAGTRRDFIGHHAASVRVLRAISIVSDLQGQSSTGAHRKVLQEVVMSAGRGAERTRRRTIPEEHRDGFTGAVRRVRGEHRNFGLRSNQRVRRCDARKWLVKTESSPRPDTHVRIRDCYRQSIR